MARQPSPVRRPEDLAAEATNLGLANATNVVVSTERQPGRAIARARCRFATRATKRRLGLDRRKPRRLGSEASGRLVGRASGVSVGSARRGISMRESSRRRWVSAMQAVVAGSALSLAVISPAMAADTVAPVVAPATFSAVPDGNANWRLTTPQTLNLSATDDVAVSKFQYSLDGGATYVDVPVTAGPTASATVPMSQEGNTTVRYRAVDSSGNPSRGTSANTTLNQPSAVGATAVRLTSTTGRGAGDSLLIDTGAAQETATIATIVTPAPAAPAPNVTLTAPLANAHAANAAVAATSSATFQTITLQIDTNAPIAIWGTAPTTLQPNNGTAGAPAAKAGDTQIRLARVTGRAVGDTLQLDRGANAETVKIASIDTSNPAAPAPNVTLTSALTKNHLNGASVYLPQVVDGKILQPQTLLPIFAAPRLQDPTDTVSNGAGGSAPRMMSLDGKDMIAKTIAMNTLTAGKHTTSVSLQDNAGNVSKYINTFVVTTSFADLSTVVDQLANNSRSTTINAATAVGAMGLRFPLPSAGNARSWIYKPGQQLVIDSGANQETATIDRVLSPAATHVTTLSNAASAGATQIRLASYSAELGGVNAPPPNPPSTNTNAPIAGQPIVLDTGANQEVIYVKKHISPWPATGPNVVLTAPLAKDHAAGVSTVAMSVTLTAPLTKAHASGVTVSNPQPVISAALQSQLQGLLADAAAK